MAGIPSSHSFLSLHNVCFINHGACEHTQQQEYLLIRIILGWFIEETNSVSVPNAVCFVNKSPLSIKNKRKAQHVNWSTHNPCLETGHPYGWLHVCIKCSLLGGSSYRLNTLFSTHAQTCLVRKMRTREGWGLRERKCLPLLHIP